MQSGSVEFEVVVLRHDLLQFFIHIPCCLWNSHPSLLHSVDSRTFQSRYNFHHSIEIIDLFASLKSFVTSTLMEEIRKTKEDELLVRSR